MMRWCNTHHRQKRLCPMFVLEKCDVVDAADLITEALHRAREDGDRFRCAVMAAAVACLVACNIVFTPPAMICSTAAPC